MQAGLVNGISREFGRPGDGRRSLVGDLGVKLTDRAAAVVALVRVSGGQAWWVGDESIRAAGQALREGAYSVASECWAALAGVRAAARDGEIEQACLVMTGKSFDGPAGDPPEPGRGSLAQPAVAFEEVLALVEDLR